MRTGAFSVVWPLTTKFHTILFHLWVHLLLGWAVPQATPSRTCWSWTGKGTCTFLQQETPCKTQKNQRICKTRLHQFHKNGVRLKIKKLDKLLREVPRQRLKLDDPLPYLLDDGVEPRRGQVGKLGLGVYVLLRTGKVRLVGRRGARRHPGSRAPHSRVLFRRRACSRNQICNFKNFQHEGASNEWFSSLSLLFFSPPTEHAAWRYTVQNLSQNTKTSSFFPFHNPSMVFWRTVLQFYGEDVRKRFGNWNKHWLKPQCLLSRFHERIHHYIYYRCTYRRM